MTGSFEASRRSAIGNWTCRLSRPPPAQESLGLRNTARSRRRVAATV